MWLRELKITRMDSTDELSWEVDIIAHEKKGYFTSRFKGKDMAKILSEDISRYLKNCNNVACLVKKDNKKSGK